MDIKEKEKIKGEYTMVSLSPKVKKGSKFLGKLRIALGENNIAFLEEMKKAGLILSIRKATNLIPTVGRSVFARIMIGDTTYSGEIDYGALGNGVSPVFTNASTQLTAEVYRFQAASQSRDANIVYIDWFINSGDVADQTFTEFAAFIDGTAAANSGQAWSLLATGGWVKSGSMYISAKYTLL